MTILFITTNYSLRRDSHGRAGRGIEMRKRITTAGAARPESPLLFSGSWRPPPGRNSPGSLWQQLDELRYAMQRPAHSPVSNSVWEDPKYNICTERWYAPELGQGNLLLWGWRPMPARCSRTSLFPLRQVLSASIHQCSFCPFFLAEHGTPCTTHGQPRGPGVPGFSQRGVVGGVGKR